MKQWWIYTVMFISVLLVLNISLKGYLEQVNEVSSFYYILRNTSDKEIVPNINLVENQSCSLPNNRSNRIWTFRPMGRLGNQIGQYATLYALAKMNGHPAYILPRMHNILSKLFKINLPVIPQEVDDRTNWTTYYIKNWMLPEYRNISGQYVKLLGVPCSWTIYHHMREEILNELTFHDFVKEEAYSYLAKARGDRKNVTYIGVHVRRGDYIEIMSQKWNGVLADRGYFQKAMDYYRNKYENPLFIVTSNGMDWCKQNIDNSLGDVHFAGDGIESSPARDFAILTHCNHSIITIGTFGIWVAYLTGGEAVYLSNYVPPKSPYFYNFKYETSYLPEWVGIPADMSSFLNKDKRPTQGQITGQTKSPQLNQKVIPQRITKTSSWTQSKQLQSTSRTR